MSLEKFSCIQLSLKFFSLSLMFLSLSEAAENNGLWEYFKKVNPSLPVYFRKLY